MSCPQHYTEAYSGEVYVPPVEILFAGDQLGDSLERITAAIGLRPRSLRRIR
jgi:hypothetical protein